MITNSELETIFFNNPEVLHAVVNGDGYKYQVLVVSDVFEGKSKVARQQWVYKQLNTYILSGQLHAVTMETLTSKEWKERGNHG